MEIQSNGRSMAKFIVTFFSESEMKFEIDIFVFIVTVS